MSSARDPSAPSPTTPAPRAREPDAGALAPTRGSPVFSCPASGAPGEQAPGQRPGGDRAETPQNQGRFSESNDTGRFRTERPERARGPAGPQRLTGPPRRAEEGRTVTAPTHSAGAGARASAANPDSKRIETSAPPTHGHAADWARPVELHVWKAEGRHGFRVRWGRSLLPPAGTSQQTRREGRGSPGEGPRGASCWGAPAGP